MRVVGMAVAVDNAVDDVKDIAQIRLKRAGGDGAVREFTELLLRARGEWRSIIERYVAERAGAPESVR
jgi:3-deoxy-D-manno-octulosonate 8-phosphate phosphatase (KDO 8-P phosphatase)